MRISGLVIATVLLVPVTLFAQRTSAASGSSSGSSSSTSASSSASSSSYSGHASGSSSSASSGTSHSSNSGGSRSSTSSVSSHNSKSTVSLVTSKSGTAMHTSPSTMSSSAKENAAPQKKGFFSFFRHPFRRGKPVQSAEWKRPVPCVGKACTFCPPGESSNGKGGCAAPPIVVAHGRNQCRAGESWIGGACGCPSFTSWNGVACGAVSFEDPCASVRLAAERLSRIQEQMELACFSNLSGQECSGLKLRYEEAQQSYEGLLKGSPMSCRAVLPGTRSLGLIGHGNPSPPPMPAPVPTH